MKTFRNTFVLFLLLFLLCSTACSQASEIKKTILLFEKDSPLNYTVHCEIKKIPAYDEARTEKLNRLLKHIGFSGFVGSSESEFTLLIDGKSLFSYQTVYSSGKQTDLLCLNGTDCYIVPENRMLSVESSQAVSGGMVSIVRNKNTYFSLDAYRVFFSRLPDFFPDKVSSSKVLEKYKYYGTAVRKVNLTLTGEELGECFRLHADLFSLSAVPDPRKIVFSNRQGFELLFSEEGQLVRMRYSGTAGSSEEDLRTVRLDWKTVRTEQMERDELQLRTPNRQGTRRNNFLLDYAWSKDENETENLIWKAETDNVADGIRTQGISLYEITASGGQLDGSLKDTVTVKGKSETVEIRLNSNVPSDDSCVGTLEIINKKDKIETNRVSLTFDLSQGLSSPVASGTAEPVRISEQQYNILEESLFSDIIRELLLLPEEDLVFLREGIPDDSWNALTLMTD